MNPSEEPSRSVTIKLKICCYSNRGIMLAFATACNSALVTLIVSFLQGSVDASKLTFFRGLFAYVSTLILLIYKNTPIKPTNSHELKFLALYSIFASFTVLAQYYAYQNMPTGDASAIIYSYIALSVIFGRLLLKEHLGLIEALLVGIAIAGVVLIMRPSFLFGYDGDTEEGTRLLPAAVALFASVGNAFVAVALRSLGNQSTHPLKSIHYCALCLIVLGSISLTVHGGWNIAGCTKSRLLTVVFCLMAFLLLLVFACALAVENIVLVTVITVSEVWMVFFVDTFLFGASVNLLSILGILLIMGSAVAISAKKLIDMKKVSTNECRDDKNSDEATTSDAGYAKEHFNDCEKGLGETTL